MRGGNFYGVGAAITPGALEYNAVPNSEVSKTTGAAIPDPNDVKVGGRRRKSRKVSRRRRARRGGNEPETGEAPETPSLTAPAGTIPAPPPAGETPSLRADAEPSGGRRRKSKKSKKSKKSTRKTRKMRGGASYLPARTGVSGFTGTGVARGMGGFEDVSGGYARLNDVTPLA